MREILFRGKRVENGEWVYGYYAKYRNICSEDYTAILQFDKEDGGVVYSDGVTAVIPETVGQYTGLTDKNGKQIFEGDILRGLFDFNAKIMISAVSVFCNGSFGVRDRRCGCDRFTPFAGFCNLKWEVIGNIHDNPELWEGEQ